MKKANPYLLPAAAGLGATFIFYLLVFYGIVDAAGRTSVVLADIFMIAAALFATISVSMRLVNLEKGEPLRRFWGLIDIALILWLVSECIWFVYEAILRTEVPSISAADILWIAGFVPIIMASASILVGYERLGLRLNWSRFLWVLPLIAAIIFGVVFWVIYPIMVSPEATMADKIYHPAYAIFNLLILIPALVLAMTLGSSYAGRPLVLLSIAIVTFGFANIGYIWLSWNGLYRAGNFIDLFWIAGYLITGLAAAPQPLKWLGLESISSPKPADN